MAVLELSTRVCYDDIAQDLSLTLRGAMGLMQEAAIVHSDMIGYSIKNVQETHLIWMLVWWRIRLIDKAFWNDNLTVRTWPRTMERAKSERDFEIVAESGHQIAVGESLWVLVNADSGRISRIPQELASVYDLTPRKVFEDVPVEISSSQGKLTYSCEVLKRDIDTNHHVNNRIYLDYARQALPEDVDETTFAEVTIRFHRQMLLGQKTCCFYRMEERAHIVDICSNGSKAPNATVIFQ